MSKIPKFESKLRKPSTTDELPDLPFIQNKRKPILRRSKSCENVRSTLKVNSGRTVNITTNNAIKMPKFPSSASKPPASRPILKPIEKPKPNIKPKVATKRPGEKCDSEVKNKVLKKSKVPDWDYKTRFLLLQESFKKLQDDHKVSEKCFEDTKIMCQTLQQQLEKQTAINENLERKYEEASAELKNIKENYTNINDKYEKCYEQLEKQTAINEEMKKYQEDLEKKYKDASAELKNIKENYTDIHDKYEKCFEKAQNLSKEKEQLLIENFQGEKLRRILHNQIQDLKGNIRVFCRVRPALNELEKINQCNFSFSDNNCLEISRLRGSIAPGGTIKTNDAQEFKFDRVFDQNATQEDLFIELSQLIQSAMDGYHVCVFAYGQTGSGKTYTMQGEQHPKESLGMIPRSVELIFDRKMEMEKKGWSIKIEASFLEIYNENIRDLLNIKAEKPLEIKFNQGKGTTVSNLTVVPISSPKELLQYVFQAQRNRSIAVTNFNEHSSRSHAVTKLYLEARYNNSDDVYLGSLTLVDLAGSESAKTVSNERLAETKNINKSLSCLGNVMMALYKKETHIPYRNSKLTYLLQSSLGGNCKCLMIVNVSPVNDSYNESINTLRFAAKVKEVKLTANQNRTLVTPSK